VKCPRNKLHTLCNRERAAVATATAFATRIETAALQGDVADLLIKIAFGM